MEGGGGTREFQIHRGKDRSGRWEDYAFPWGGRAQLGKARALFGRLQKALLAMRTSMTASQTHGNPVRSGAIRQRGSTLQRATGINEPTESQSCLLVVVDEVRVRHVQQLLRVEAAALRRHQDLIGDHVLDVIRPESAAEPQVRNLHSRQTDGAGGGEGRAIE